MKNGFSKRVLPLILGLSLVCLPAAGCAQKTDTAATKAPEIPALTDNANTGGAVPILANEQALQTVTAVEYLKVTDDNTAFLEGTVYDKEGNLYFVNAISSTVYKVTPDKQLSKAFVAPKGVSPASIKIGRDGRLYLAGLGNFVSGTVISCNPDGSDVKVVIPNTAGYLIDEIVFDNKGGFYFADARGIPTNPTGGVYYVSPDFKTITPVLKNMAFANGLVLSADQKVLYVTEMAMGRLHKVDLQDDGISIGFSGANIPYYFTGTPGPDSATIDSEDNVYVAMFKQGKVLVFDKEGFPIGQILIPGRENGKNLWSTHVAFIPGTDQLVICTSDVGGTNGATLYTAKGFAKGANEYQFQ